MHQQQLVEVRPISPFVGSYRCGLSEADFVDDVLTEKDGVIVKDKVPKKRFVGLVAVRRQLTDIEIEMRMRGDLDPAVFELEPEGVEAIRRIRPGANALPPVFATVWPKQRTVRVPADMARSLAERGLAEIVAKGK